MFRNTRKRWWPGCDVYYAYKAGNIPAGKFHQLHLKQGIQYIKKHYPADNTHFSLNQHDFRFGYDGVRQIAQAIPGHVTSLHLNVYGFRTYSDEQIKELLTPLAQQITSISLSYHDYDDEREDYQWTHLKDNHPGAEISRLIKIINELRYDIGSVDICCKLSPEDWKQVLSSLPPCTTHVNIGPAHALGAEGMKLLPQSLPSSVASVEVSRCNLNEIGAEGLAGFIKSLPESVTFLNLSFNQLSLLGRQGINIVLAAVPAHLTVKLDYNNLEDLGFENVISPRPLYRIKC